MTARTTRRRPRIRAALAAVTCLGLAVGVGWLLRPEPGTAAVASEQARRVLAKAVAPTRDVSSTMTAPATGDWWTVVTGFAGPLDLTGTPLPDGARWLGLSTARAATGLAPELPSYPAVYVGFDTADQAGAYRKPAGCTCKLLVRGNVVTLMGANASPTGEPFPDIDHLDPARLASAGGAWRVNVTALVDHLTESSPYADQQAAVFDALGADPNVDDPVIWTATAEHPEGPWTGPLDGFDADAVDLLAVGRGLADTVTSQCVGTECTTTDPGILETVETLFVEDGSYEFGNRMLGDPDTVNGPLDGAVLRGGLDLDAWAGTFTGLGHLDHTGIDAVWFTVTPDPDNPGGHTLTLRLTLTEETP